MQWKKWEMKSNIINIYLFGSSGNNFTSSIIYKFNVEAETITELSTTLPLNDKSLQATTVVMYIYLEVLALKVQTPFINLILKLKQQPHYLQHFHKH